MIIKEGYTWADHAQLPCFCTGCWKYLFHIVEERKQKIITSAAYNQTELKYAVSYWDKELVQTSLTTVLLRHPYSCEIDVQRDALTLLRKRTKLYGITLHLSR